jgi:hypothetical protein
MGERAWSAGAGLFMAAAGGAIAYTWPSIWTPFGWLVWLIPIGLWVSAALLFRLAWQGRRG